VSKTARILAVDDDPATLRAYRHLLRRAGHEVLEATSGSDCLEIVKEYRPDLVLLDVVLPDISGVKVCQHIKADPDLKDTFIILCSGHKIASGEQVKGLEVGADGYIVLPIPNRELLARVEAMLRIKHAEETTKWLLNELRAQQKELEGQNEELHKTLTQLEESRSRYSDLYDFAPVGYLTLDENGLILEANLTASRQLGAERRGLINTPFSLYVATSDRDQFRLLLNRTCRRNERETCDIRLVTQNGRDLYALLDIVCVRDAQGKELYRTSVIDISKRRQAEEDLGQAERKYREIFETAREGIYQSTPDGRYITANPAMARIYGYSSPEDLIVSINSIDREIYVIPEKREELKQILATKGEANDFEVQQIRKDGTIFWVSLNVHAEYSKDGTILYWEGRSVDITERKQAEDELTVYRDHLEDLVQERTAALAEVNDRLTREIEERTRAEEALRDTSEKLKFFAYSVAHDLKSPAVGVYGLAKRLQKTYKEVLDEKGKLYCDQILTVSEHIAALVEKINVYIATKESRLSLENIHLKDILRMVQEEFSTQLSIRQIDWLEPETAPEIRADRLSMLRAFRNFVDNSLKYGGERLSKIWIGYEESGDFHVLSVSDNGKGLRESDSEKIFGAFQRQETSRGVEGAGLGLTIVKEIAEQHGGRVWIEPRTQKGTTFYISISKLL
jgi:PAS domain S-box-containing protein